MIFRAYNLVKERFGKSCPHFPHHNIDAYRKSDVEKCYLEYKDGFDKTEKQKFREKECIQRSIFSYYAIANNLGSFKIVDTISERFIAYLTCKRIDSLLIELRESKLKLIKKYRPCLFCLNDSLKTTDEDRLAMRKFLNEKFPKASGFEKLEEDV